MVILKHNVRTKAGLLPAGTDVEGKLSDEVVEDLIKTGLASRPSEKVVSDSNSDDQTVTDSDESQDSNEEDQTEQEEVKEDEQSADDAVDLNLPETGNTTKTTTRGRGRKAKS
tara:strand:- start:13417 stop:13755 length:339 start_codon:yes stop_codon:yes gene_type:complete